MNEDYMQADDMLDLLRDRFLSTPEYIELIAGTAARINTAEGLNYTVYLSVSGIVHATVMRKTDIEVTIDNLNEFQMFRSGLIPITDTHGLKNLLSEIEVYLP